MSRALTIRSAWQILLVLPLMFAISACNDDDDSGTGPVDPSERFTEMADAIADAEADFITSNAEITASLAYFAPYFAATLGIGPKGKVEETSGQLSCLPEGIAGKLYNFNGTSYVADVDTGVAEEDVRFRLYQLYLGEPVLSQRIGYAQFTCAEIGTRVAEVQIVAGNVLMASLTYSEATRAITGGLRSADGTKDLLIEGMHDVNGRLTLHFLLEDADLQASFSNTISGSGTHAVTAEIIGPYSDPSWGWDATFNVEGDGDVVPSGGAFFREEPDILSTAVACIGSGTVAMPVFTSPTTTCPVVQQYPVAVTAADLTNMSEAYHWLQELWTGVAGLVEADLAILSL